MVLKYDLQRQRYKSLTNRGHYKRTPEIRKAHSRRMKALWSDLEFREKVKGKIGVASGYTLSLEARAKQSLALKGKKRSPETNCISGVTVAHGRKYLRKSCAYR